MYRSFLSWRYLRARLTNLIGIVGLTVAVGALIMILSIMTGFLEETRRMVRGNLADLVVQPDVDALTATGGAVPRDPSLALDVIRADPRVVAAAPRLVWAGMVALDGRRAIRTRTYLSDSEGRTLSATQIVGVDVRTHERFAYPVLEAVGTLMGFAFRAPRVQDDLDTTDLLESLARAPHPFRGGQPVANPLDPFAPPPGYQPPHGPRRASVVVGEQLFDALGLRRGDELELGTFNVDPVTGQIAQSNRRFVIAGSFRSGENEMDLGRVYVDRRELIDFLGETLQFTEILVRTRDYEQHGRALQRDLERKLSEAGAIWWGGGEFEHGGQVRTWEDFRRTLLGAIENERVLMAIMLSLILLVAGFTVFAILTMMVTEKRRDIGILAALGAPPRGILSTFLMIGFWDALLGATIGAVLGTLAAIHIDAIEQWLSRVFGFQIFNRDVYFFDRIPSQVDPLPVALIVGGAFVVTLACAAFPAWRAARLDPLVALRYE